MKRLIAILLISIAAPWICRAQTTPRVETNSFKGTLVSLATSGAIVVGKEALVLNPGSKIERGGVKIPASELRLGMEVSGVYSDDGTNKAVLALKALTKGDARGGALVSLDAWKQDPVWTSNQSRIQLDGERKEPLETNYEAARKAYLAKLAAGADLGDTKARMDALRKQLEDLRWEATRLRSQQWRIESRYRAAAREAARGKRGGGPTATAADGDTNGLPASGK